MNVKPAPSYPGAIDCDIHVAMGSTAPLLPYLDEHWHEQATVRDITNLELTSNTWTAPGAVRPDWRAPGSKRPESTPESTARILDQFGSDIGILNCMYGAQSMYAEDMGAAFCRAINDWIANEWLSADPRFRASIVVPMQNAGLAAEEIRRRADDKRFVAVQMMLTGEMPLGRRYLWPIYEEAEKAGLPITIHPAVGLRFPPTATGWGSSRFEDEASLSQTFQAQLFSMMVEGVFEKFPGLRVVAVESGVTWLPQMMWRADRLWRAMRFEVPWLTRSPSQIIREHMRFTLQPFDGLLNAESLTQLFERVGTDDIFMFSTDYPHWHFEGTEALAVDLADDVQKKLLSQNARSTYVRLEGIVQ